MVVVRVAVACAIGWAVGWVTAPFVVLRRGGTIDEQRRASIREETCRVGTGASAATGDQTGASAATGDQTGASAATGDRSGVTLPAPRRALDGTVSPAEARSTLT